MPQNQSSIRFSLEELIWFKKGQEVEELLSISLDPHITIQELEQYVVIKGNLYLAGEYIGCGEEEGEDVLFRKYVQAVQYREEDGIFEFYQSFPVDVTIPKTRIADIEELDVNIEGFDYQFHGTDCLKINADIAIEGILQDGDEEEDEAETAPYPDLNGRETYLDEPDAAYQAPFSHSEWSLSEQEEESTEPPRHFMEEAESFEEVPLRADEEKEEEDESHADPELYTPFTIESRVVPEESVAQPEPYTNELNVLAPVELPEEEEESLLPEAGGKVPESASWQAETAAPVRDEWHAEPEFSGKNESASLAESELVQNEWHPGPEFPGKNESASLAESGVVQNEWHAEADLSGKNESASLAESEPVRDEWHAEPGFAGKNESASLAESGVVQNEWHAEPEFSGKNESASIAESVPVRNEWQADPVRDEGHPEQELSGKTASAFRTESKTALNEESLEPDDAGKTEPVFRIESKAMEDESSAYLKQESPEKDESSSVASSETIVEESPESGEKIEEVPEEKDSAAKKKKKQKYESISLADFFARRDEEKPAKLKVCIVQSGETLDQLAEKYNINVQQILRMNHLEVNQDVYEGQVLYVPANARAEKNH
ncbi:MAG: LysM peptidoglycan-binding domain-containing protein [Heyndrickxia faecalis]|uniref:LysM peptidoglycan-binding domain-containing protein n=1 Tax=Heyndrickxia TaxID=2837504 RepID=UPI000D730B1D|nr:MULTISPECIES: LysM peptidoglycan-binding domain-containing protein [Heyndrickxia]AWP37489.1 stage VI sporulation protein D [Heyndrickxia coagulans]MEC2223568.1 LysM peptidoglycan-binding domain-containing protein [Weizmannia sp. CD-2023]MED4921065.1 LysM peptidoglycan-binding domain-containing protein [Weizmannia sp. CD-2023]QDI62989.1 LysM peptidoglycan-binding domain-containing protein [Heyndrickxia coagulans]UXC21352.1 LysM peptidoglycan-binding domain-containing protein [Heyndrickxia co